MRSSKESRRQGRMFYFFVSPWLLGFIVLALFPILASLYYSFTEYDIINTPVFIGADNYRELFQDEQFWNSIGVTLKYTFISVPLTLLLSLFFAMLINQKIPFRGFFRTAMYFPSMISGVSMALLWFWVFNPQAGLFNYVLSWFGVDPSSNSHRMLPLLKDGEECASGASLNDFSNVLDLQYMLS
ncbi:sugar ABC transporter permease [Paenibacillus sp. LHD-117]|uniref:carbohydrate ABC transporter permease n=1 Tax=Paenibacillus sp. LHD-117 TaxID=3071412 RepID=UPI0027DFEC8E|nr:sugar ABC transporter permease [Paenibacillus sp. LHD-117]MDQ6419600.1 sugar ABC transporter permease [Paenibacillus sp. LHD-117]